MVLTFRQSLLEGIHGVVLVCTLEKTVEVIKGRVKEETLREKL